jgi:hypothetical protein
MDAETIVRGRCGAIAPKSPERTATTAPRVRRDRPAATERNRHAQITDGISVVWPGRGAAGGGWVETRRIGSLPGAAG